MIQNAVTTERRISFVSGIFFLLSNVKTVGGKQLWDVKQTQSFILTPAQINIQSICSMNIMIPFSFSVRLHLQLLVDTHQFEVRRSTLVKPHPTGWIFYWHAKCVLITLAIRWSTTTPFQNSQLHINIVHMYLHVLYSPDTDEAIIFK